MSLDEIYALAGELGRTSPAPKVDRQVLRNEAEGLRTLADGTYTLEEL